MTSHNASSDPTIFPYIRYQDARRAVDWLCRAFGFEQLRVVPGSQNTVAHAELRLGNGVVMLASMNGNPEGMKVPRQVGGVTQAVYIAVDDVDAHCRKARAEGAEIVWEPADTDFGSREYAARDPEGHVWSFGIKGVDLDQR